MNTRTSNIGRKIAPKTLLSTPNENLDNDACISVRNSLENHNPLALAVPTPGFTPNLAHETI